MIKREGVSYFEFFCNFRGNCPLWVRECIYSVGQAFEVDKKQKMRYWKTDVWWSFKENCDLLVWWGVITDQVWWWGSRSWRIQRGVKVQSGIKSFTVLSVGQLGCWMMDDDRRMRYFFCRSVDFDLWMNEGGGGKVERKKDKRIIYLLFTFWWAPTDICTYSLIRQYLFITRLDYSQAYVKIFRFHAYTTSLLLLQPSLFSSSGTLDTMHHGPMTVADASIYLHKEYS
jgi:hypothetical protein